MRRWVRTEVARGRDPARSTRSRRSRSARSTCGAVASVPRPAGCRRRLAGSAGVTRARGRWRSSSSTASATWRRPNASSRPTTSGRSRCRRRCPRDPARGPLRRHRRRRAGACRIRGPAPAAGGETIVSVKSLAHTDGPGGSSRREELEGPADRVAPPSDWPASDARALVLEHAGDAPLVERVTIRQLRRVRQLRGGRDPRRAEPRRGRRRGPGPGRRPVHRARSRADQGRSKQILPALGCGDRDGKRAAARRDEQAARRRSPRSTARADGHEPDAEARRAIDASAAAGGARGRPSPRPTTRPASAEPRAGHRARPLASLAEDTVAEAGRKVMRFHLARMLDREPGVRDGKDIEDIHKMRVATRRQRAAWRVFGEAFRKRPDEALSRWPARRRPSARGGPRPRRPARGRRRLPCRPAVTEQRALEPLIGIAGASIATTPARCSYASSTRVATARFSTTTSTSCGPKAPPRCQSGPATAPCPRHRAVADLGRVRAGARLRADPALGRRPDAPRAADRREVASLLAGVRARTARADDAAAHRAGDCAPGPPRADERCERYRLDDANVPRRARRRAQLGGERRRSADIWSIGSGRSRACAGPSVRPGGGVAGLSYRRALGRVVADL